MFIIKNEKEVFILTCKDCNEVYISKTGRNIKTIVKKYTYQF